MNELIELNKYPVKEVLPLLLKDKTTGKNIVFATDTYSKYGFYENDEITVGALFGFESCDIQPRVFKDQSEQTDRTRKKAEVFSPTWICNKMNNHCDSDWFGRGEVFNAPEGQMWNTVDEKIVFSDKKDWKKYVDSRRLEITCGEAPYIVSRYDATTGEPIEVKDRIGFLDRKLRVVSENTETEAEWIEWATRAVQSVYGYEFQGDNLLIARINILITFCDYYYKKWGKEVGTDVLKKIANIISWNFWQMDGFTNSVPEFEEKEQFVQMALFDIGTELESSESKQLCKIQNWRKEAPLLFDDIQSKKRGKTMKFDYVIGNPPYQDSTSVNNRAGAIYPFFYDAAESIADKYMLISPARFLFNGGLTPKEWNQKMLSDPHLKVIKYYQDCTEVFPSTDIKGGIAIVYRNALLNYGEIGEFIPDENIRKLSVRFRKDVDSNLPSVMYGGRSDMKFNDAFLAAYPDSYQMRLKAIQKKHPNVTALSVNEEYEIKSSTFEVLSYVFKESEPDNSDAYYKILGLMNSKRVFRWIEKKYLSPRYADNNIDNFKIFVPESNGSGEFGEVLSTPIVANPGTTSTPTFISIGKFNTCIEAENALKYIKTKLTRALLGIIKKTQHNPASNWAYVPLQDFTSSSDIDWSKSIAEIDGQLYRKYGLSDEEIEFIETHVKEMN